MPLFYSPNRAFSKGQRWFWYVKWIVWFILCYGFYPISIKEYLELWIIFPNSWWYSVSYDFITESKMAHIPVFSVSSPTWPSHPAPSLQKKKKKEDWWFTGFQIMGINETLQNFCFWLSRLCSGEWGLGWELSLICWTTFYCIFWHLWSAVARGGAILHVDDVGAFFSLLLLFN